MELDIRLTSKEINEILWRTHKTISTAESCTAGKISSILTGTPGASAYFKGGLVAYTNEVKIQMLGVDSEVIDAHTAVCEEVARQMVLGAIKTFGTDYAVASKGFAGPGGPDLKTGIRVRTIWVAAGNADNIVTLCLTEDEGRDHNILKASAAAIHILLELLKNDLDEDDSESNVETL